MATKKRTPKTCMEDTKSDAIFDPIDYPNFEPIKCLPQTNFHIEGFPLQSCWLSTHILRTSQDNMCILEIVKDSLYMMMHIRSFHDVSVTKTE